MDRILSSVAQAEVERKGIRRRRANRQRAEQGRVRLVRRPFGYDLDGRIVRREANALQWAADRPSPGLASADGLAVVGPGRHPRRSVVAWLPLPA